MDLLQVRRPLGRLLAVGQQCHPRSLDAEHGLGECRAHVRELNEVLGPAADVCADVEQQQRADAWPRQRQRQRRAVDAAVALDVEEAARPVPSRWNRRTRAPAPCHRRPPWRPARSTPAGSTSPRRPDRRPSRSIPAHRSPRRRADIRDLARRRRTAARARRAPLPATRPARPRRDRDRPRCRQRRPSPSVTDASAQRGVGGDHCAPLVATADRAHTVRQAGAVALRGTRSSRRGSPCGSSDAWSCVSETASAWERPWRVRLAGQPDPAAFQFSNLISDSFAQRESGSAS